MLNKELGILDCYKSNGITYIDLHPKDWIEKSESDINKELLIQEQDGKKLNFSVVRTSDFFVGIFLKVNSAAFDELIINGLKVPLTSAADEALQIQVGIIFRENPSDVTRCIDFYRKSHGIRRFIVYNFSTDESDPSCQEIKKTEGVFYYSWCTDRVTFKTNNPALEFDKNGLVRFDKNSAINHCLKKYSDSEWTLFVDSDELLVNPSSELHWLEKYLRKLPQSINTVKVRGYLGGKEAFDLMDLPLIVKRTDKEVKKRLILRTKQHKFTQCIHDVDMKATQQVWLPDAYFFHLDINTKKKRIASLTENIHDKSLFRFLGDRPPEEIETSWWGRLKQFLGV